jgi:molybdopterin-guanine dinucleotide biosynthesis protein A
MGRDKALLPHPEGGCWLERTLRLLGELELPITLLSRHREHRVRAEALAARTGLVIAAIEEPPPWEGPLRALERLMALHTDQRLLLCPVDLPHLTRAALDTLRAAADEADDVTGEGLRGKASGLLLAHDGERLQPLLGVYPSSAERHRDLAACLGRGERGLQRWLVRQPYRTVQLEAGVLRNVNHAHEILPFPEGAGECGDES